MRKMTLALVRMATCGVFAGCALPQGDTWVAIPQVDRFVDIPTKMVTIGEGNTTSLLWTKSKHFYPFVGLRGDEILFGIRSGGQYKLPVGAVQVRIDGNKTWDISPEETPVYLIPGQATIHMPATEIDTSTDAGKRMAESIAASQAIMKGAQESSREYIAKTLSPFTAATGDKAKTIIREMLAGRKMIYRSVGYNQAASSEGEVLIDDSFIKAVSQIGITRGMLESP